MDKAELQIRLAQLGARCMKHFAGFKFHPAVTAFARAAGGWQYQLFTLETVHQGLACADFQCPAIRNLHFECRITGESLRLSGFRSNIARWTKYLNPDLLSPQAQSFQFLSAELVHRFGAA